MDSTRGLATSGKIRVLIIAGPDSVADWMASVIGSQPEMAFTGLVRHLVDPTEYLVQLAPHVILVDLSSGILKMGEMINALTNPASGAAVIVVALRDEVDAVQRAMLHGAQGFLLKPFSEEDLLTSIRRAHELIVQRRAQVADAPALLSAPAAPRPARAQIVTVYSPKGGVGCTTLAVNLAVALRSLSGLPVRLIDGDLRFGDIDTALNIVAGPSVSVLVNKLDEMDNIFLEQSMITNAAGIQVLTAPPYLDMADAIPAGAFRQIVSRLAQLGPGYLVIDTWSTLDELTLTLFDASDRLVVVTAAQMTSLRDTHRFLEALGLLGYDSNKIALVLNHPYPPGNVKRSEVERALGHPIVHEISHAPQQVAASLNRGVPLVLEFPDSPPAKDLVGLARLLHGMEEARDRQPDSVPHPAPVPEPKRRRLFAWSQPSAVRN